MGIIDRSLERDINWADVTRLEVIGLDEISLKQGHRDFVAIITGRMETETIILGVLPDRKKATVKAFRSPVPLLLTRPPTCRTPIARRSASWCR